MTFGATTWPDGGGSEPRSPTAMAATVTAMTAIAAMATTPTLARDCVGCGRSPMGGHGACSLATAATSPAVLAGSSATAATPSPGASVP